jgi:diguanylate cyclase (GGDEF)-like protein
LVLDNVLMAERLWELSTFDGLTGLLNQRSIRERLVEEVDRAVRHSTPMAVLLCDIDRFKLVNDTHGHLVGDAVLREMAVRLTRGLRVSDVIGRYGGEEFLAILPHADLAAATVVAQRMCDDLCEETMELGAVGKTLRVTASFGVACSVEVSGRSADTLLGLADRRLYQAKNDGRACVRP